MEPRDYGPFPYVPITQRPKIRWPNGARLAVWVIPNIEFFSLQHGFSGQPWEARAPAPSGKTTGFARTSIGSCTSSAKTFEKTSEPRWVPVRSSDPWA